MATEVLMPKLGLTMTEGTIEEWKYKEGDAVKKGDILFSVATDKLTNDVECEEDGTLLKILLPEGETHQRIVYPGQIILPQLKVKSGTIHQGRYGTRSNVQCQSIRVKGLLIPVLPTLYRTQVGEQQSVMRIGGLHFQSLFNVFFGQ